MHREFGQVELTISVHISVVEQPLELFLAEFFSVVRECWVISLRALCDEAVLILVEPLEHGGHLPLVLLLQLLVVMRADDLHAAQHEVR